MGEGGGDPNGAGGGDARFREILENVAEGVYFVDRERRITFWNRAASEISGHAESAVVGRRCPEGPLQHVDMEGRLLCHSGCPLTAVLADGQPRQADILLRHRDGHRVPVRVGVRPLRSLSGEVIGAVETFTDITALFEVQRRVSELERMAFVDPLTGLGNRRFAQRQLDVFLSEKARYGRAFGALLLDIDGFKDINDAWGHEAGDAVLQMLGRTLAGVARAEDFVGRWGGDEFLVLVRESDADGLTAAGERIRRTLAASKISLGGAPLTVTLSIGATVSMPTDTASDLLRRADSLLYLSKKAGRDRITVVA